MTLFVSCRVHFASKEQKNTLRMCIGWFYLLMTHWVKLVAINSAREKFKRQQLDCRQHLMCCPCHITDTFYDHAILNMRTQTPTHTDMLMSVPLHATNTTYYHLLRGLSYPSNHWCHNTLVLSIISAVIQPLTSERVLVFFFTLSSCLQRTLLKPCYIKGFKFKTVCVKLG